MKSIDPYILASSQLHRLLLTVVAPRPIALVSTVDAAGQPNLSPFSCFNVFGVNPSTLIFSPSRGGRDNRLKHTYRNVKEVPEVVINMVTYEMVEQVNLASTEFPKGVNEFLKSGFTPLPSEIVKPFRVKESPVQMECTVRQVVETSDGPGSANLVICEVLRVHLSEKLLDIKGQLDPRKLDLVGRMGADYYVRASGKALFTVEKPGEINGIGVDSLPEEVRMSTVLTGNDLGKLGMLPEIPSAPEVLKTQGTALFRKFISEAGNDAAKLRDSVHSMAQEMIARKEFEGALKLLLALERYPG